MLEKIKEWTAKDWEYYLTQMGEKGEYHLWRFKLGKKNSERIKWEDSNLQREEKSQSNQSPSLWIDNNPKTAGRLVRYMTTPQPWKFLWGLFWPGLNKKLELWCYAYLVRAYQEVMTDEKQKPETNQPIFESLKDKLTMLPGFTAVEEIFLSSMLLQITASSTTTMPEKKPKKEEEKKGESQVNLSKELDQLIKDFKLIWQNEVKESGPKQWEDCSIKLKMIVLSWLKKAVELIEEKKPQGKRMSNSLISRNWFAGERYEQQVVQLMQRTIAGSDNIFPFLKLGVSYEFVKIKQHIEKLMNELEKESEKELFISGSRYKTVLNELNELNKNIQKLNGTTDREKVVVAAEENNKKLIFLTHPDKYPWEPVFMQLSIPPTNIRDLLGKFEQSRPVFVLTQDELIYYSNRSAEEKGVKISWLNEKDKVERIKWIETIYKGLVKKRGGSEKLIREKSDIEKLIGISKNKYFFIKAYESYLLKKEKTLFTEIFNFQKGLGKDFLKNNGDKKMEEEFKKNFNEIKENIKNAEIAKFRMEKMEKLKTEGSIMEAEEKIQKIEQEKEELAQKNQALEQKDQENAREKEELAQKNQELERKNQEQARESAEQIKQLKEMLSKRQLEQAQSIFLPPPNNDNKPTPQTIELLLNSPPVATTNAAMFNNTASSNSSSSSTFSSSSSSNSTVSQSSSTPLEEKRQLS